jgi:AraC family transcriptional regulator
MEIRQEQPVDGTRNQPQPYCDFWDRHSPAKLLLSSTNRGWSGVSAELRAHSKSLLPWWGAPTDIHVCVDIRGNGTTITRRANGIADRTVARRGMVWICPAGWQEGSIDITGDLPEIMHIYLPPDQFSLGKLGLNIDGSVVGAMQFERALADPLLGEMAHAIASEPRAETSAGKILVESLTNCIAARLVQMCTSVPAARSVTAITRGGLDRRRLLRVLDYIEANLEDDLSVEGMASIVRLSRFHFARAFRQAVGESPHRYVSGRRLEHAKTLLLQADRPLADIALALGFSSQANFTRAFKQATGVAPGRYRRAGSA